MVLKRFGTLRKNILGFYVLLVNETTIVHLKIWRRNSKLKIVVNINFGNNHTTWDEAPARFLLPSHLIIIDITYHLVIRQLIKNDQIYLSSSKKYETLAIRSMLLMTYIILFIRTHFI